MKPASLITAFGLTNALVPDFLRQPARFCDTRRAKNNVGQISFFLRPSPFPRGPATEAPSRSIGKCGPSRIAPTLLSDDIVAAVESVVSVINDKSNNTASAVQSTPSSTSTTSEVKDDPDARLTRDLFNLKRKRAWSDADAAYNAYTLHSIPSPRLLGTYIQVLISQRTPKRCRLDEAQALLDANPGSDSAIARSTLIGALARRRGSRAAYDTLQATPRELWSAHACTAVMHALALEQRPATAARVLQDALASGVAVDVQMFDTLIRALGRVGRLDQALTVLNMLRNRGFQPTACTFEGLVYACAHAANGEGSNRGSGGYNAHMLGRRALMFYEAANASKLGEEPRILSAIASVVLRADLYLDDRVDLILERILVALQKDERELRKQGVHKERLALKYADLARCRQMAQERKQNES